VLAWCRVRLVPAKGFHHLGRGLPAGGLMRLQRSSARGCRLVSKGTTTQAVSQLRGVVGDQAG
jgi:hypothetical protein